ncbi:hypothetical protein SSP24_35770 [Streptomyces spinoverrucosus]|uniref:4Fe-4S Wbl-type domain-containing protein n=1 Tax=Streptomyces spinoverrucosus TaxID=284043 RepID=A0A4Y3VFP9_9ACTN|nr:hypothetical protein SSP24_35770 [Streptomyces spinoverrucosus]GHB74426.1 hypothetical protein GCM10010397_51110 [Streptomyces spinoverrucosus]
MSGTEVRADTEFHAYSDHVSNCRECSERLRVRDPVCDEARRLGKVYLTAYRESGRANPAEP